MLQLPVLSISILIPLFSAFFITFFINQSRRKRKQIYVMYVAILSSVFTLIATTYMLFGFNRKQPDFQFVERYEWIRSVGLEYHVGVDGLSLFFIFLTALLTLVCVIASCFTIKKFKKEFLLSFLLLESFSIGSFSALNMLLFYGFFEVILIPMYLIIGVWGGENRIYAAVKFFLYTFFGSVFLLLALIYIYSAVGSFDMVLLKDELPTLPLSTQKLLWLAMFMSFAVKVPMPPFHTWLPDAHVQAPTSGSVILAGILLKLGGYAFLRFSLPMLPDACEYFSEYVIWISAFAVVYASFVALAQTDMKKMIAYSSVAHMGYVTGGMFSFTEKGISGAVFQMISHGLISSALFLIVGMLYERHHTKEISKYGGVAAKMPFLASMFMIAMLGSVGLPGLSGFVGEFLSIAGIFEMNQYAGCIFAFGVVIGAVYMLKLYRNVMFGEVNDSGVAKFKDLYLYEKMALLPLIILLIYIGLSPDSILRFIAVPVQNIADLYSVF